MRNFPFNTGGGWLRPRQEIKDVDIKFPPYGEGATGLKINDGDVSPEILAFKMELRQQVR